MKSDIRLLFHSSIKIAGEKVIYCDPFEIDEESHDADIILISHDHHDHFSPNDIKKVMNEDTIIITPLSGEEKAKELTNNVISLKPYGYINVEGVDIDCIPAYNISKQFHPKENDWLAFIITMNEEVIFIAGDSDVNEDNLKVKCDIALVPIGGKYTMDAHEAASLVNTIKPKIAIPTHYGSVAGNKEDEDIFKKEVSEDIEVKVLMERYN